MKSKLPRDPLTIRKIKDWLKKDGNSTAKLAVALGYKTSTTIDHWISRGRVSEREKENVIAFIKGASNGNHKRN